MMPWKINTLIASVLIWTSCSMETDNYISVYQTSSEGDKLKKIQEFEGEYDQVEINIDPSITYQRITGFGGSFTEASAHNYYQLSEKNQRTIMEAYFGQNGANYSLARTHINSCDFSLSQYAYSDTPDDTLLKDFSIEHDRKILIPFINEALKTSEDGFQLISSPWTAPPWMKDNGNWVGGKLKPEYRKTWALYFAKYIEAYRKEGIEVWGVTVENEPLGNGNNWESMHFTASEMTDFVQNFLGPTLQEEGCNVKILGYDQNRGEELKTWVDTMYQNEESSKYFDGTAVHWYASTYDYMGESLDRAHQAAPDKHLIQTEGCVDAEVPVWKDDAWYWSKQATDWGWDWAPEHEKFLHPKYAPVNRYARDMIGCLNHWVDGWVDWNMILDRQGGPNWFKNWCVAPVIVDVEADEVYITPLYYVMAHFSRFIRPGAVRIGLEMSDTDLMATAAQNPDGTISVVLFNEGKEPKSVNLKLNEQSFNVTITGQAIQTIQVKSSTQ
jgi:glucosylceramidase